MKITAIIVVVSLATILALDAYAEANHNAVLICGSTVGAAKSSEYVWWNGGRESSPKGMEEFWNDLYLMWEVLYKTSMYKLYIPPGTPSDSTHEYDHIWVLYGDGEDYDSRWIRYQAEKYYELERITDDDARMNSVTDIFQELSDTMTNQDNLFVYTGNHGQPADFFRVLDASDPESPSEEGHHFYSSPVYRGEFQNDRRGVFVSGDYAYVARLEHGMDILDISIPSNPESLSSINTPNRAWAVSVLGDYAYVAAERSFRIIEVSDPSSPEHRGHWGNPDVSQEKYLVDVCVSDTFAYVLNQKPCRLHVLNVSRAWNPESIGTWVSRNPIHFLGHGICYYDSCVYVAEGAGGLSIIDVRDPSNPVTKDSCYSLGTASAVDVVGNHVYVAVADSGLRILNRTTLAQVGHYDTQGQYAKHVYVVEGVRRGPFTHAYVACDLGGLQIVDASTPETPELLGHFDTPFSVWDVHCQDGYAYIVGTGSDQVFLGLWPLGTTMADAEFAARIGSIECGRRVFLMNQCFAGGFIDDLSSNQTVMITANRANEMGFTADDIPWEDIDEWQSDSNAAANYDSYVVLESENELHGLDTYYNHGEFGLHVMNALRGWTLSSENRDSVPTYADLNEDLLISIKEAFKYVGPGLPDLLTRDSWRHDHFCLTYGLVHETTQYDDPGGIGASTFLGWDDGEPPARPTDLRDTCDCSTAGPYVILNWNDNTEPDKVGYWTYRDGNRIAASYDSRHLDSDVEEAVYAYEVSAFDLCGNESVAESVKVSLICGDPNADGAITFGDAVYIKNFYYQMPPGSPPPHCPPEPYSCCGDVNVDGKLDFADALYIKNYVYQTPPGSPPPCEPEGRSSSEEYAEVGLSTPTITPEITEISVLAEFDVLIEGVHLEIIYDSETTEMLDPVLTSRTKGLQLFYNLKLTPGRLLLGMADFEGSNYIEPGKGSILTLKVRGKQGRSPDLKSLCLQDAMFMDMNAKILQTKILNGYTPSGGPQWSEQVTTLTLLPTTFELSPSYPNPSKSGITVCYAVPRTTKVTITIYDVSGTLVRSLVDRIQEPGYYRTYWKGEDSRGKLPSGVYFVRMEAEEFSSTRKVVLVR